MDAGMPDAGAPPPPATCIPSGTAGSGHHNPGMDCMSCHASVPGFQWTVAGTLFGAVSGGTAVSGATIEITDASGAKIDLVTADNGNFFTTQPVVFPLHVRASRCPADISMSSAVDQGSCNSCHGSAFRIHLP
jgi:hypothetical protein